MRVDEKIKLLIVCEDPSHCTTIEEMFRESSQSITRAGSEVEALKKINEEDFSIIVMDRHITDLKGFETAYNKVWPKLKSVPVILFTAFSGNDSTGGNGSASDRPGPGSVYNLLHSKISQVAIERSKEYQIMGLLREKELLTREMNHRVKNNLQTIASMLNIQTFYVNNQECLPMIQAIQSRIKSIAMVYESLYESENIGEIDFGAYIQGVVANIFKAFTVNEERIRPVVVAERVLLDRDLSMHCGLILNELITNAIRYAFGDKGNGEITVSLKNLTDGQIEMRVQDSGIGFPENLNYKTEGKMGLLLVNALAEQIHGSLNMERGNGTTFSLQFARPVHTHETG